MKIEELLSIEIGSEEWLDICNYNDSPVYYIQRETLLDYVAMKADKAYDEDEDEVAKIMNSEFEAEECLGMNAQVLIDNCINVTRLVDVMQKAHDEYCSENNLCSECHSTLQEDEYGKLYCPQGC